MSSKPKVAEGEACKVLDLLSIYGFRGDVELMVGLAVQPRVLGGPSPLAIVLTVVADWGLARPRPRI